MALSAKEEKVLKSIVVASENDPNNPEFPPENPKFPATPTYKIDVPGFSNVWLKDESVNLTGTHKDRMAWEMVVTYRNFLLSKKSGQIKGGLPRMSIISFGSTAIAIQTQFNKYNLPPLKVLTDSDFIGKENLNAIKQLGCETYETDLSKKPLSWREILILTHNQDGIDITSSEALDPTTRFYDWLSYEIINNSPDYCFIPFGTGNLFENVLNINKKEVSTKTRDPRFKGKANILRKGKDLTIVATSWMNVEALKAAEILAKRGVDVEVVDPRTIVPLDEKTIIESVEKTGRCIVADNDWVFCGFSGELSAIISEKCFGKLKYPVQRIGLPQIPCPTARHLENEFYPNAVKIIRTAEKMLKLTPTDLSKEEFYSHENRFKGPF